MANWFYYDSFDFKQGPITQEDLQSLVAQGIITPQTKMETEDGKQGLAGQIKGLFPQPPAPPLQNYPPQYSPPAGIKPPTDYLVWSVITTLCCCLPLGIVAIIMSVQAKSAFQ
ncbi:MAG: CD225/dispanin family protein, partial [Planctomycetaceae bacterium]|nr:CD225/dispanin family protein [Planctomycetaceae bacterium]